MGRFDIIKENAFSSNDKPEKRKRGGRGKKKENVSKVEYNPMVKPTKDNVVIEEKEEIKKEEIKKEEIKKEEIKEEDVVLKPIKSDWLNKINKVKEEQKKVININDPNNWNGPYWKGPMFLRAQKPSDKYKHYLNTTTSSCIIIPHGKTEYSKNGVDWCNSWNKTFTARQLENIEIYEEEIEMDKFNRRLNVIYERDRAESIRHYEETGELDSFAWAEEQSRKYDEYCKQFEISEPEEEENDEDLEDDEYN